jgi:hypothetical protein
MDIKGIQNKIVSFMISSIPLYLRRRMNETDEQTAILVTCAKNAKPKREEK